MKKEKIEINKKINCFEIEEKYLTNFRNEDKIKRKENK